MHPAHAVEAALATEPEDYRALIERLPRESGLRVVPTRDNDEAEAAIRAAEGLIVARLSGGAQPLKNRTGWSIRWSDEWWFLYGDLYARRDSHPDETSPLLLVNRNTKVAFYGRELARLARRVLGHSLAWHELTGTRWAPSERGWRSAEMR
jgi:hypothetical protein